VSSFCLVGSSFDADAVLDGLVSVLVGEGLDVSFFGSLFLSPFSGAFDVLVAGV
jgi:hypothetical protein